MLWINMKTCLKEENSVPLQGVLMRNTPFYVQMFCAEDGGWRWPGEHPSLRSGWTRNVMEVEQFPSVFSFAVQTFWAFACALQVADKEGAVANIRLYKAISNPIT